MALKRFTVAALDAPLGVSGVFHFHEGDIVLRKVEAGPRAMWVVDTVKATLDEGFVCSTHELIPWSEQGVSVMHVAWVEEVKIEDR